MYLFNARYFHLGAGGIRQRIGKILVFKIQELVVGGARSVTEVRRHHKIYVEQNRYKETQALTKSNQRFYRSKAKIRRYTYTTNLITWIVEFLPKKNHRTVKLSLMCNCRMPRNKEDLDNPDLWVWSGFTRSVLQQCLIQFSALKMSSGCVQNANHNFRTQITGIVM